MAWHQQAHEFFGFAEAVFARDDHIVDVFIVEIANGALDQRAFFVDEAGRRGFQRQLAHGFPHAHEIFKVATHFLFGAGCAGCAQDDAHAIRHFEFACNGLEALAVGGIRDLA